MSDDPDSLENIIKYKLPFFVIGVAVGMGIIWIAFQLASGG